MGSPKVVLLQAAGPVSERVTYALVVPYLTLRVPLKLQTPPSCAHRVQDEFFARASAVGSSVLANAALAVLASPVLPLPPPQAANTAADRKDRPTERAREAY